MQPRATIWVVALLAGACSRSPGAEQRIHASPSVAKVATAAAAPAPSAAPVASAAPSSAAAAPLVDCKAHGAKGAVVLGSTKEPYPRLRVEADGLYVFGYTHELARVSLSRISRAGGKLETVATQKGLGEVAGLAFGGGAAYYTQHGSLFKLGPAPGAAVELRQGATSPPALAGDRVFVVECDKKGPDRLFELPSQGGEASLLAELAHTSTERCQYSSLVADAKDVFVADWRGSRVLAVSRADKSLRELISKKGFPSNLVLDGEDLALFGALGLLRVPRAGGVVKKQFDADKFAAPFSSFDIVGSEYWLVDQLAYETTTTLWRMPRDANKLNPVAVYKVKDPVGEGAKGDTSLRDFAVDDQCVYTAEWYFNQPVAQLVARAR